MPHVLKVVGHAVSRYSFAHMDLDYTTMHALHLYLIPDEGIICRV